MRVRYLFEFCRRMKKLGDVESGGHVGHPWSLYYIFLEPKEIQVDLQLQAMQRCSCEQQHSVRAASHCYRSPMRGDTEGQRRVHAVRAVHRDALDHKKPACGAWKWHEECVEHT